MCFFFPHCVYVCTLGFYFTSLKTFIYIHINQWGRSSHTLNTGCCHLTASAVQSPLWTVPSSKVHKKGKSFTVNCSTRALSLLYKTLWAFTVSSQPVQWQCSGLHRHLAADICTEQRGQLELQPKFWLCSCQARERGETQRNSSLPFTVQLPSKNNHGSTHLWYYVMLHYFWSSCNFFFTFRKLQAISAGYVMCSWSPNKCHSSVSSMW